MANELFEVILDQNGNTGGFSKPRVKYLVYLKFESNFN